MHILVTAASKHGATDEVAAPVAKRIEASGITVDRLAPADVTSVEGYDAVIVGSAVYILQWMPEAHDFMERFKDDLPVGQVWAFSVGMNGVPKHSRQDGSRVGPLLTHVKVPRPAYFRGALQAFPPVPARAFGRAPGRCRRGGLPRWEAVDQWADEIIEALKA